MKFKNPALTLSWALAMLFIAGLQAAKSIQRTSPKRHFSVRWVSR